MKVCAFSGSEADNNLRETQSLNLSSVDNARELGGYSAYDGRKVKRGVLLRTAALNTISSADIKRLTEIYHLGVIADLRMSFEAAPYPDPFIDGVKYTTMRVIDEEAYMQNVGDKLSVEGNTLEGIKAVIDSGVISDNLYIEFLSGRYGKKAYTEFFRELLELPAGRSLLFHCTQGKDRTGCAAMLIFSALGSEQGKYLFLLNSARPAVYSRVTAWLKENYGSPVGYIIHELGITDSEISALKSKFLEEE